MSFWCVTARLVRDNNTETVQANERTDPQHLIQVAINLLKATGVDWQQVRNVQDLKTLLNRMALRKALRYVG
ncbi:MAG: hypothetical protein V7L22_15805 [Nostoc sp.]|uniref:hypothetical protein n=1 Tax=Nostoc sp. TaxID=1180 RepID=UPI002FFCFD9D